MRSEVIEISADMLKQALEPILYQRGVVKNSESVIINFPEYIKDIFPVECIMYKEDIKLINHG